MVALIECSESFQSFILPLNLNDKKPMTDNFSLFYILYFHVSYTSVFHWPENWPGPFYIGRNLLNGIYNL